MSTARLNLLLHPVRMRMVNALAGGTVVTTSDLCRRMPDLPKATVYRHVDRLVRGGVVKVVGERRVRGAVERQLTLSRDQARIDPEESRSMTLEDHQRSFTAATAALLAEFNRYLDHGEADPLGDGVSYRQFTVWMTPAERSRVYRGVRRLLTGLDTPGKGRAPYLISTIVFPTGSAAPPSRKTVRRRGKKPRFGEAH